MQSASIRFGSSGEMPSCLHRGPYQRRKKRKNTRRVLLWASLTVWPMRSKWCCRGDPSILPFTPHMACSPLERTAAKACTQLGYLDERTCLLGCMHIVGFLNKFCAFGSAMSSVKSSVPCCGMYLLHHDRSVVCSPSASRRGDSRVGFNFLLFRETPA